MSPNPAALGPNWRKRIVSGITWATVGTGLTQMANLFVAVVVGRWLGKSAYGELGALQISIATFTVFAGPALAVASAKFIAEYRVQDLAKTGRFVRHSLHVGISLAVAVSLVFAALSPFLARYVFNAPNLVAEFLVASIVIGLVAVDGTTRGVITGFEGFRPLALVGLVRAAIGISLQLALVPVLGVMGALIGLGAFNLIGCVGNLLVIRRLLKDESVPIGDRPDKAERKLFASIFVPKTLSALAYVPISWLIAVMLIREPGGFAEMGILNAGLTWRLALLFLPSVIATAFVPLMNSALGEGDVRSFGRLCRANIGISTLAVAAPAVVVYLGSSLIIKAYGEEFSSGLPVLRLLVVGAVLTGATVPIGNILMSLHKAWAGMALNAVTSVVTITAAFALLHRGAEGMAIAYLIGHGWHMATSFAYLQRVNRSSGGAGIQEVRR